MAYPGSQSLITVIHDKEATGDLVSQFVTEIASKHELSGKIDALLAAVFSGMRVGSVQYTVNDGNAVSASGTVTLSGAGTAGDTVVINGVTFTAVASGATGNQWNVGGSATLSAAAIASAINGSATALVNTTVAATSAAGVVTITAASAGPLGNAITLAATGAGTASGARLTSGAAATNQSSTAVYKSGV